MTELLSRQIHFTMLTAIFIAEVYRRGYVITTGDGERNPMAFGEFGEPGPYGHPKSNHKRRLAHDWHLYKWVGTGTPIHRGDGSFDYSHCSGQWVYCSKTEDHYDLGQFWKGLNPLCRWGGDFRSPDGNHYSLEYQGMA